MTETPLIKVAIPSPLRLSFDYLPPISTLTSGMNNLPLPGTRVLVPFGRRELVGLVIGESQQSTVPISKLKPVLEIIDAKPIFDADTLSLYLWASEYYHYPIGQALQASLPKHVREGKALEFDQEKRWRRSLQFTQFSTEQQASSLNHLNKAPQQHKLFELINKHHSVNAKEAKNLIKTNANVFLKALHNKGLIETYYKTRSDTPPTGSIYGQELPLALNNDQQHAVSKVSNHFDSYQCFLLEGITGSGKTEVYLHLIAKALELEQQVLVLVPEINLTPQTLKRIENRFNRPIVALHSGLNDKQRFNAWLQAQQGHAAIIVGTRSAIFTPMLKPGLIIIDEEHDSSYKQQEGFRYNARDLAIYRARLHGIPILLGSATPSLESLQNALSSRFQLLSLKQRAGSASTPNYRVLDLSGQSLDEGFSQALLEAIKTHLTNGNQVLIFINRRGFSPLLQCSTCGWIATCSRCDTSYTLHQYPPILHCHHCDSRLKLMPICPACKAPELSAIGLGTERSENLIKQHFSDYPVLRIDRDTTTSKDSLKKMLATINTGKPCVLIGTQMLAKGHHFPKVTLVAVLDADSGLFSADFRGQEQMGQLLTQVSGRAGRGENKGEVLIQTFHSTHPALSSLINDGYGKFARSLILERQQAELPPFSYHILIKAEANNRSFPENFLFQLKKMCNQHASEKIIILGPMPAPMEKRAGRFRAQLLLQSKHRGELHHLCGTLIKEIEQHPFSKKVRWSVDVDPLDFT